MNISHGHQPSSDLIMLPSQGYTHNMFSFSPYSHIRGSYICNNARVKTLCTIILIGSVFLKSLLGATLRLAVGQK